MSKQVSAASLPRILILFLYSLRFWQPALEDAWSRRDEDHKFKIVCGVHNVKDMNWQSHITYWARRDAIRLLSIADQ